MHRITGLALVMLGLAAPAHAEPLRVMYWNIQNDDSATPVIAEQLAELHGKFQFHLIGLSEVDDDEVSQLLGELNAAAGASFTSALSSTGGGGGDYLAILYDAKRFAPREVVELTAYGGHATNWRDKQGRWRLRPPFALKLLDQPTGRELLFMVNHLKRGDSRNADRDSQVRGLNAWAADQTLPVIAGGDYNFDLDINSHQGNPSCMLMLDGGSGWRWVTPDPLVDSNWAEDRKTPAADDRYPNTLLDFVFTAGPASTWPATAHVIVRSGDFPDDATTSDHRPVWAEFRWDDGPPTAAPPASSPTMSPAPAATNTPASAPSPGPAAPSGDSPTSQPTALVEALRQALVAIDREVAALSVVGRALTPEEQRRLDRLAQTRRYVEAALALTP